MKRTGAVSGGEKVNCTNLKKHIVDFIENNEDERLFNEIDGHIAKCSLCRYDYEDTKHIVSCLKRSASAIHLKDRQKRELKEAILKAPVRKRVELSYFRRDLIYAMIILAFLAVGIYFLKA
jgi:hypothetical protein